METCPAEPPANLLRVWLYRDDNRQVGTNTIHRAETDSQGRVQRWQENGFVQARWLHLWYGKAALNGRPFAVVVECGEAVWWKRTDVWGFLVGLRLRLRLVDCIVCIILH